MRSTLTLLTACAFALAMTACDSGSSGGDNSGNDPIDAADSTDNGGGVDAPDAGGDTGPVTGDADTVGEADGETSSTSDVTPDADVPPADPCDSMDCSVAPDPSCDDNGNVSTSAGDGTCMVGEDDNAYCDWATEATTCPDGEICAGGACAEAGDPNDYAFSSDATYLSELTVPGIGESCCFDFNGDGVNDNKLGTLLATLESQFNVNELIGDAILDGSIAIVFEETGLDGHSDDESLGLNGFVCDSEDTYEDKAAGNGNFLAEASSFLEGTQSPLITFGAASIAGGLLEAGPSLFVLSLPLLDGVDLNLTIHDTQIEAMASAGSNGSGLDLADGKLGGVIPLGELYNALNAFGDSQCQCLGLEGPLIGWMGEGSTAVCNSDYDVETCNADPDTETCATIAGACGLVTTLLKADIDTNLNGVKDAISIGLNFVGVSATITGVVPAE
jgi:hypothetical protein